jgi:hypothetical protein
VTFRRPADQATLTVSYHGREPATVTYDGTVLTVAVPPLAAGQSLALMERAGPAATCMQIGNQGHLLRCTVPPTVGGTAVLVGILIADPPPTAAPMPAEIEGVELGAGCSNVTLTWPDGTPTGAVARAVTPPAALVALWRYDAAQRRFLAFSPRSAQASDLTTVNRLDAVFICMEAPGTLIRPAV